MELFAHACHVSCRAVSKWPYTWLHADLVMMSALQAGNMINGMTFLNEVSFTLQDTAVDCVARPLQN